MDKLQHRAYKCEVRANNTDDGQSIISGRPIVYDAYTDMRWFQEVIDKGALNETDLQDVRFLVNHDTSRIPLARSRRNNGNSTMKLTPDEKGLFMESRIDTANNNEAKALRSAVDREDITGMSFMFTIEDERWENLESNYPTRHILKIGKVVEVSAVSFPAYDQTSIYSRDSQTALDNARKTLENVRAKDLEKSKTATSNILELEKAKFNFKSKEV